MGNWGFICRQSPVKGRRSACVKPGRGPWWPLATCDDWVRSAVKMRCVSIKYTLDFEDLVHMKMNLHLIGNFYIEHLVKVKYIRIHFDVATGKMPHWVSMWLTLCFGQRCLRDRAPQSRSSWRPLGGARDVNSQVPGGLCAHEHSGCTAATQESPAVRVLQQQCTEGGRGGEHRNSEGTWWCPRLFRLHFPPSPH